MAGPMKEHAIRNERNEEVGENPYSRFLVVGAGGVGGYFGGRLLEAERDVTFLVRPQRAAALAERGLIIKSQFGDFHRPAPPTVTADKLREPFNVILLSSKAYDLDSAIEAFAPAVGPHTAILPLLNGMRHLDMLDERFGPARVLGGQCFISAALNGDGAVIHFNDAHNLTFGERDGSISERARAIESLMAGAKFDSRLSQAILLEMFEKWIFIATGAGMTCLMRAPFGDILAAGGADLTAQLYAECAAIASASGYPPRTEISNQNLARMNVPGSTLAASMFRDIERNARIEADQIIGDLLDRGNRRGLVSPLLRVAYTHLKTYEARRERELT
jgi:2-dehydropantoate 2-reductase